MKKELIILALIMLVGCSVCFVLGQRGVEPPMGYSSPANIAANNATNSSVTFGSINVATTVDANSRRNYLSQCYSTGTADKVLLQFATDTSIKIGSGYSLSIGECWEMYPSKFLWLGQIWTIATDTGSATLSIIEW